MSASDSLGARHGIALQSKKSFIRLSCCKYRPLFSGEKFSNSPNEKVFRLRRREATALSVTTLVERVGENFLPSAKCAGGLASCCLVGGAGASQKVDGVWSLQFTLGFEAELP